jgi:hypothetical protein
MQREKVEAVSDDPGPAPVRPYITQIDVLWSLASWGSTHTLPTRARGVFTRGTLLERARRLHGSLTSAEIRALACTHRTLFVHSDPNTSPFVVQHKSYALHRRKLLLLLLFCLIQVNCCYYYYSA